MANGDIVSGNTGLPVYGRNGTLLYKTNLSMSVSIVISWSLHDLDICGFYTHYPNGKVGWNHSGNSEVINDGNGFSAKWYGDNTSGGPEKVDIWYSGQNSLNGKSFEIHANWYNVGEGSGGDATITATDAKGYVHSLTIKPATDNARAARAGDPGAIIRFNYDGSIKDILAA